MSDSWHPDILSIRAGWDRNNEKALTHTYAETATGLFPMCGYGWNRSNGTRLSIFRGVEGHEGDCMLCHRNLYAGKPPVYDGFPHKTKYL